ncbi:ribonuclease P protein component [Candidatus Falkowbacteria bacterium RIFOXYD2_FULL_35_9]|uniref:Ribonuclease P protein component n=1 Tax=Candidatus Falkowbacteria bacterium RIFOXYC2_FULL_36_12 TaxID=1798002 RepID=A0A1F5T3E8_9BACT|nr:MAG: ribonuclease P protein component [Candidatus Falkowbacteria bacterium RIFOXYC2_FULL_36_12]OGF34809.1 MAG: ribonuclease P protein component [Candidatus Falkowbacteria bacterium RIFOXYA2_FULL_35_8]OGF48414.1 MAG: ribonuclease P protein component [Candidatus Falkowbacteria bacterium RIFOXYD2_FULL_35_9]
MLAKENRITSKKEFDSFFGRDFRKSGGFSASSKAMVVKAIVTDDKDCRVGFIINTKIDKKAVVRNKIKRQFRDIMKNRLKLLKKKVYLLFVVMPAIKNLEFAQIEKEVDGLLKRMRLL